HEITLNEITTFNLSTRYDDYKRVFYNKCTDEYTEEQRNKIKEVKTWLEIMLK
ncbi:MAG: DNA-binding protein, partial [Clostridia bacterium]|nr:DNA-binding protein [Clostridia bacterium]